MLRRYSYEISVVSLTINQLTRIMPFYLSVIHTWPFVIKFSSNINVTKSISKKLLRLTINGLGHNKMEGKIKWFSVMNTFHVIF